MFKPQASPPPSESLEKPFGWDVTVEFLKFSEYVKETYHFRGCTQAAARRKARTKAIFQPGASKVEVLTCTPLSEATWIRAYGLGHM